MNETTETQTASPAVLPARIYWFITGLSVFWVLFLWGFWERHVFALGINASLFLLGLFALAHYSLGKDSFANKCAWYWIAPLLVVSVSYSLFENPFIKLCNLLFIPVTVGFLTLLVRIKDQEQVFASYVRLLLASLAAAFEIFVQTIPSIASYNKFLAAHFVGGRLSLRPEARSVLKGLVMLSFLAFFIVIPLLGSADNTFGKIFTNLYQQIANALEHLFELEHFWRLLMLFAVSAFCISFLSAWTKDIKAFWEIKPTQRDQISAAVLIFGVLVLYLIFIFLQFDKFWEGTLPVVFNETEAYVKSGFWQLVVLTGVNLLLAFSYFHQSDSVLKFLLACFVIASLLLLGSAAHRMYLYVTHYGLSYEKFYASYTVLYCAVLFAIILISFTRPTANITKLAVLLLLWMYSLVTVLPVEYMVSRANLALSYKLESRMGVGDLKILSIDALPFVKAHRRELAAPKPSALPWQSIDSWISSQEKLLQEKSWYEYSISAIYSAH